tara:strand:- start:629 stop:1570 length:942 start_codon:yes stop_codon:yes gene_type:complete
MKFKKPKFWDLKKPNLLSLVLYPLTIPLIINNLILKIKSNKLRDEIKTICVGNIYVGGTGKTPATIRLYHILKKLNFKVTTAKKFYTGQKDENEILKEETRFITGKTRKSIIQNAIDNQEEVLIFDDGLQDRNVNYDLKFVCFDSDLWIGNGNLIPSGPLREKINSLKKYDAVFIKDNNSGLNEKIEIIRRYNSHIKIFETFYELSNLKNFDLKNDFLIFSGIGNPENFKKILLKNNFMVRKEIVFPDHYTYTKSDIEKIEETAKKINAKIITTKKDYVKIIKLGFKNINYLDLNLKIKNEENLINFIKQKIL